MTGQKILEPSQMTVSVTVVQAGKPDIILKCPGMLLIFISLGLLEFFWSLFYLGYSVSLNSYLQNGDLDRDSQWRLTWSADLIHLVDIFCNHNYSSSSYKW